MVYRQARLLGDGGDFRAANARHEYAYTVLLRSHGGSSPALLPGLFALADWYMSGYNIFSARELYEHAAEVAEKRLDDDHPAHIRALRSVAATYRRERFPPLYKRRPHGPQPRFLRRVPIPPVEQRLGQQLRQGRAGAHQGHQHRAGARRGRPARNWRGPCSNSATGS